jgi:hypothetical protein
MKFLYPYVKNKDDLAKLQAYADGLLSVVCGLLDSPVPSSKGK